MDFRLLLRALRFGGLDVVLVALNQRRQFFRAVAIEFDPAALRRDLVLQALHFGARFVDPGVDFLELPALRRDRVFMFFDFALGGLLLFVETPRGGARFFQFRL